MRAPSVCCTHLRGRDRSSGEVDIRHDDWRFGGDGKRRSDRDLEMDELCEHATWLRVMVLLISALIVSYLISTGSVPRSLLR